MAVAVEVNVDEVVKEPSYGGVNVGKGNEEGKIRGFYKDGTPISEHPSQREIEDHIEEYLELLRQHGSAEQRETMNELRNSRIMTEFRSMTSTCTDEQVIEQAIKLWAEQWPWEVKSFFKQVEELKFGLYDHRGYAKGDRSMIMYGQMPDKVKSLCMSHRQDFWQRDKKGKCKNLESFYRLCPKAKISSFRGSA